MLIRELSIITITFNNAEELNSTYQSLEQFRKAGGYHIIVNGGRTVGSLVENVVLIEEPDKGIYDAINKGIEKVNTPYFMLIHSGDTLIESISSLEELIKKMKSNNLDLLLNDCSIEFGNGQRLLKSTRWKPWMFLFGAQPPHPPIIYRTAKVKRFKYDLNHPVIADFKYLEDLFQAKLNWDKGNKHLIHMSAGGATSSGIKSFFFVNEQFSKLKGPFKMILFAITRPFIKVYQMI